MFITEENITIVKIIVYLVIGGLSLSELMLWRLGVVPPRPFGEPVWLNLLFSASAPSYTMIYGMLSFWVILVHLEEMEATGTDLLEGIFSLFGFCSFLVNALIIPFRSKGDRTGNVILVVINMVIALFLLFVSIGLFVSWQFNRSRETLPSYEEKNQDYQEEEQERQEEVREKVKRRDHV